MPDKLTDKEIVKSSGAGANVSSLLDTINGLILERSNLIAEVNQLQAEKEVLEARIGVYETCNARKDEAIRGLEAENERLQENLNIELENFATEYDNKIKAEAYKEFAERLKKELTMQFGSRWIMAYGGIIDNLLKEMRKSTLIDKKLAGEDNADKSE